VYHDVIKEVKDFLKRQIEFHLDKGITKEKIIIDPGIGFGKKTEHNLRLLKNIDEFKELDCPILVGHSRKRFISAFLDRSPDKRDGATVGVSLGLAMKGVHILRVHRVDLNRDAITLFKAVFGKVSLS